MGVSYRHVVLHVIKTAVLSLHASSYYPVCMRRGKVIGLSVCQSVVTTKIVRSRNLGLRTARKHNQSVEIGERLA